MCIQVYILHNIIVCCNIYINYYMPAMCGFALITCDVPMSVCVGDRGWLVGGWCVDV